MKPSVCTGLVVDREIKYKYKYYYTYDLLLETRRLESILAADTDPIENYYPPHPPPPQPIVVYKQRDKTNAT
jgi:hypothetical protein